MSNYAIEMLKITKKFGTFVANNEIDLLVKKQTIHALVGENGAGKSTLMSILFGIHTPTSGKIKINGKTTKIKNPNHATELKIGMVHQHFKLVEIYNAVENIILGHEPVKWSMFLNKKPAREKIEKLSHKFDLKIDLDMKVQDMSVGMQQRVEILKMLYSDADILIFDEPTAVLTPQEIQGFLNLLKDFRNQGKTIILITHKLNEIMQVADEVTVIRKGNFIKNVAIEELTPQKIAELMVGHKVVPAKNTLPYDSDSEDILSLKNISIFRPNSKKKALQNISFSVKKGEVLAIAGVEGNGQTEIALLIAGILKPVTGKVFLNNKDISFYDIRKRYEQGLSHIPEDSHKYGIILDESVKSNMVLQEFYRYPFSKFGLLNDKEFFEFTFGVISDFDVRGANHGKALIKDLSGGNQQKAVVGREMKKNHNLLIAVQPTRGLDIGAIEYIHKKILAEKADNKGVLLISYELDEVMALADRIIVLNDGKITGEVLAKNISRAKIGSLMAGITDA